MYTHILVEQQSTETRCQDRTAPATCKLGWSKHGFSRIPSSSNMVIIDIFAICYLGVF